MLAMERSSTGDDLGDHAGHGDSGSPLEIVPFEPWHFLWLDVQATQESSRTALTLEQGQAMKLSGPCYTAFAGSTVIASAGVTVFWEGRAQVWSLLSKDVGRYAFGVHRAVKRFLSTVRVARLECVVDPANEQAVQWAVRLEFKYESTMPRYTPDGSTQWMMVRIT